LKLEIAIVLGFIGFAGGGPIAAVICFLIGLGIEYLQHSTKGMDQGSSQRNQRHSNVDFSQTLLVLAAHIMNADGIARKSELSTVKQLLLRTYGEEKTVELLLKLRTYIKNPVPIFSSCRNARSQMAYSQRFDMLRVLFRVAMADGEVNAIELQELVLISSHLGIQSADFYRLRTMYYKSTGKGNQNYRPSNSSYHYTTLGINKKATEQEAKRAFRKLALQYHPDKYSGKSSNEQDKAEEQFINIKRAYDTVKKERGWE